MLRIYGLYSKFYYSTIQNKLFAGVSNGHIGNITINSIPTTITLFFQCNA